MTESEREVCDFCRDWNLGECETCELLRTQKNESRERKLKFTIEYPKKISDYGMNSIYKGKHWSKRKADSDYWHWLTRLSLKKQKIPQAIFKKPVKIKFYWNDRFDIDNHTYMGKMIVDALKGYLIKDDTRKYFNAVEHCFYKKNCITVEITETVMKVKS